MKTLTLLIASLVLVTQSYAFSTSERNLLLGLGAGAIFAVALNAKDVHVTKVHHARPVYVNSNYERKIHKKRIVRENRRHEKELRRENRRHERHYDSHHRDSHYYSKHHKHTNKHYRKHNRSYERAYASNNSYRNYRY